MNTKEHKLTPKLRFQEFSEGWKKAALKDIITYTKGYAFKSKNYISEGVRVIRVSDLGANEIENTNNNIYINPERENEFLKYKLFKDEIIITTVGSKPDLIESSVGRGIFIKNNNVGLLNQNMLKINLNSNIINKFLIGYINTPEYFNHINNIKRGNANQANITVVDLLQYKVLLPQLPEQQKIATFLTAVDTKITQLTKKKTLLEQYKKGIMQKLFTQELRFKPNVNARTEGEAISQKEVAFPDWESKKLGNLVKIKSGTSPSGYEFIEDALTPFLKVEELNNSIKYQRNSRFYTNSDKNLIESYSVIFPKRGAAIMTNKVRINDVPVIIDSNLMAIIPIKTKLSSEYLYYKIFHEKLYKIADTSTIPQINNKHIEPYKIKLPSIKEQTKIANFLSAIDTKINHVTSQLEQTNTFKKGLLQQLFV